MLIKVGKPLIQAIYQGLQLEHTICVVVWHRKILVAVQIRQEPNLHYL